jgi:hypothetical protein
VADVKHVHSAGSLRHCINDPADVRLFAVQKVTDFAVFRNYWGAIRVLLKAIDSLFQAREPLYGWRDPSASMRR